MKQVIINHLINCLHMGWKGWCIISVYALIVIAIGELILKSIYRFVKFTIKMVNYHKEK